MNHFKFYNQSHTKEINHLDNYCHIPENEALSALINAISITPGEKQIIYSTAYDLVYKIRKKRLGKAGLDAFLLQYGLDTEEGIALMCLAEALLRIPDTATRDMLIKDKIGGAKWGQHFGKSKSLFVNAATVSLMLTGKVVSFGEYSENKLLDTVKKVQAKLGEPIIRSAVVTAMKILGKQFIMGENIQDALQRSRPMLDKNYSFSYDMLGEAAYTMEDAEYYFKAYHDAIVALAKTVKHDDVALNPGISIKLSALDPRYQYFKLSRMLKVLYPKLKELALLAKQHNLGFTIDAEEVDRLTLSLELLQKLAFEPELKGWNGLGLALQAYQKRAFYVIDYLKQLAAKSERKFMLRLVKGAYWDTEIKITQVEGFADYPVFTRKAATDVSYIACAEKIMQAQSAFYPQFATHNAYTVASILSLAQKYNVKEFEFQRLHGMGEGLYEQLIESKEYGNLRCRIYAPVGGYKHLLAYLVRRLLENGANSSFVNRIIDEDIPIESLIRDPVAIVTEYGMEKHPKIPLPPNLFDDRKNSQGLDLSCNLLRNRLEDECNNLMAKPFAAYSIINGKDIATTAHKVFNPANTKEELGEVHFADEQHVTEAVDSAAKYFAKWSNVSVNQRATILEEFAENLEKEQALFLALLIKEAGKTLPNAVNELREAVDFCYYYAACARQNLNMPLDLPGPTGETDNLRFKGRGVIVCISPWNFPLAIFLGQIVAALVTGNTVIAKAAEQTSIIAYHTIRLLLKSNVPKEAVHLLLGTGEKVGAPLVNNNTIAGVMFTGSSETARIINIALAKREAPIAMLIAETGGQNAMIVDSSALIEQVTRDVVKSAFDSAGQRCSALRVLYIQDDIADDAIKMLKGAMDLLITDDPSDISNDIGPVIDEEALKNLTSHVEYMKKAGTLLHSAPDAKHAKDGFYFAPRMYQINNINELPREVFGPILHVIRFKAENIDKILDDINNTGYGLTFGVHSRIAENVEYIVSKVNAGNCYINRNTIGAVVGVQPFGGERLSGTGPKAGGPHYLFRLCTEKTISIDTTAAGGNASLMNLEE